MGRPISAHPGFNQRTRRRVLNKEIAKVSKRDPVLTARIPQKTRRFDQVLSSLGSLRPSVQKSDSATFLELVWFMDQLIGAHPGFSQRGHEDKF